MGYVRGRNSLLKISAVKVHIAVKSREALFFPVQNMRQ